MLTKESEPFKPFDSSCWELGVPEHYRVDDALVHAGMLIFALHSLIMKLTTPIAICLPLLSSVLARQQRLISPEGVLRDAKKSDMAAVTTIIVDAFAPGPIYRYLSPEYASHKSEFWQCMYAKISEEAEHADPKTTFAKVIAVDDKPVSLALWNIRSSQNRSDQPHLFIESAVGGCTELPGSNTTRVVDFERQMANIERKYFIDAYPNQLYLNVLATHPSWDGHGYAARHLQWGKEKSLELSDSTWHVTLLATPAGFPLYDSVGFQSVTNATIRTLDDSEDLWFEVMQWQAEGGVSA
jgi:hypothetical protein